MGQDQEIMFFKIGFWNQIRSYGHKNLISKPQNKNHQTGTMMKTKMVQIFEKSREKFGRLSQNGRKIFGRILFAPIFSSHFCSLQIPSPTWNWFHLFLHPGHPENFCPLWPGSSLEVGDFGLWKLLAELPMGGPSAGIGLTPGLKQGLENQNWKNNNKISKLPLGEKTIWGTEFKLATDHAMCRPHPQGVADFSRQWPHQFLGSRPPSSENLVVKGDPWQQSICHLNIFHKNGFQNDKLFEG